MSQFSAGTKTPPHSSSPPNDSPSPYGHRKTQSAAEPFPNHNIDSRAITPPEYGTPVNGSPVNSPPRKRSNSRPLSMVLAHNPPLMDVNEDTIPELQPIFTYLNSHSNKLYQEGYFLKLDDQNTQGKPNPDRTWTECFAQLVGTVLSLWDAAELDAAGEDGEVLPKFINLTDASIKMIESLPTRSSEEQPLQNILSISTAGRNRYLLHFNSHHSLLQWTAGIRLAMFEHSTLQEAYTGALIAGKGKTLNNINIVMERSRFKTEEWVRVRFGAGVPWRRCWCVISPPDEKEYSKLQKELKKRSPYDRSPVPTLKGDIKFYDTRKDGKKQKKAMPIASITDAYSAYAIYPQAKSLIDASTLLKIEGNVSIHTDPPSSTEGFVFIMPETHPMVNGFEMLLRFLFPTWDTFGLYGRPGRLVASVLDTRSLMFAMPKHKRYGYLENLDVSNLILEEGSAGWLEKDWRKKLKEATGTRMNAIEDAPSTRSRSNSRKSVRLSFGDSGAPGKTARVGFSDSKGSVRSSRSHSLTGPPRTDSAPPESQRDRASPAVANVPEHRTRNASDPNHGIGPPHHNEFNPYTASPQRQQTPVGGGHAQDQSVPYDGPNFDDNQYGGNPHPLRDLDGMRQMQTPEPVSQPPAFNHAPQARPVSNVYHSPELRQANSRLSMSTLAQLANAGGLNRPNHSNNPAEVEGDALRSGGPPVLAHADNQLGISANDNRSREALSAPNQNLTSTGLPAPLNLSKQRSKSPLAQSPYGPPSPYSHSPNSRPSTSDGPRSPMPPGYMAPPRSPHPQNPNYRSDQGPGGPMPDGRRPSDPRPPPGHGPPPHGPMPGNNRRPSDPRAPAGHGPPNHGPMPDRRPSDPRSPPGHGPPPHGAPPYGNNFRPGPRGPPGPQGSQGPPGPPGPMGHRKPIPDRSANFDKSSTTSGSSAITTNEIIDHYAFDQGRHPGNQGPNFEKRPVPQRQGSGLSGQSSQYDDASSNRSIDYASTHKSSETNQSIERPRAGVLKTTGGNDDGPDIPPNHSYDIPEINFGPTVNYGATQQQARSKTPIALQPGMGPTPPPHKSIGQQPPHERTGSDETKRTMAWHPGTTSPGSGPRGLTAEQYVQQKAAHARSSSSNTLNGMRSGTPTNMKRTSSHDMLQRHSRSSSADLLSRPGSRGANATLNYSSSGELSSSLSAREQEQVAKMTGTPLISMAGNQRQQGQGSGLVGAIEAREMEKQYMKQGVSSQVQQAINQRQQQQTNAYKQQLAQQQRMAQQQMAQQQQQMAQQQQMMAQQQAYQQQQMMAERSMSPQPPYSPMGRGGGPGPYSPGPYSPGGPPYGGQQLGYGQPPQAAYGQPSFSRPLQSPQFMPPPQGQYGQPQGQQRSIHPTHQGQAF
ncbi:PH domain-containing protein [Dactylonectria macrodidyma]|uniref:PH domain-containing protein n=1 Tax=Dactylonectria macrodidyma TaxID=307937 RepID=A0A9P9FQP8_9HYPO|nr:PH domain-containing protein [Dactylonectria macrodidyma]